MVSVQLYAFFTVLLASFICTSCSYNLFGSVPCPKHALRNCMTKVPSIGSANYCKDAIAAIDCAMVVARTCPDNDELIGELIAYNPMGLSQQIGRICRNNEN